MKSESQLDFIIEDKALNIDYQNVENVTINYYMIDLEILFSKTPFLNSVQSLFLIYCIGYIGLQFRATICL